MRALADVLGARLGQTCVIENKPGAQGVIGVDATAKAAPDGYTFGLINLQLTGVPAMRNNLPFDLQKDLVPIAQLTFEGPTLTVNASLPPKTLGEFIAYARSRPGKLNYATPGAGSPAHLGIELLMRTTGIQLVHVPYKTVGAAVTDLAAGRVDAALLGSAAVLTVLKTGRVRPLAVSSPRRLAALPEVPTLAEAGFPGLELRGWVGMVAPVGTPADITERMNREINVALKDPKVVERMTAVGSQPVGGTAEAFRRHIASEAERWQRVVSEAHISAD